jgi:transcriptional regulator with XRE-family HTH domain
MPRFVVDKVYPKFLAKKMQKAEFAELAGVSRQTLWRALDGEEISELAISKIANTLGLDDVMEYLDFGKRQKKNVTIIRDDGTTATVELTFRKYDNGEVNEFGVFEEHEGDFEKALQAYFNPPVKVEDLSSTPDRIIKKISGGNSKTSKARINAEIKVAEAQGYHVAAIYVDADGSNDRLFVFEKGRVGNE